MNEFLESIENLKKELKSLEGHFLASHIPHDPELGVDAYRYDVMGYFILCHAAIEDYIEGLSLTTANAAIEQFLNRAEVCRALLSLVHHYGVAAEDSKSPELFTRWFDRVRTCVEAAKVRHSKAVFDNHGVHIIYMKALFYPTAIDLPNDEILIDSLKKLAADRGVYAHKKSVARITAPEEAVNVIADCLRICEELMKQAAVALAK